MLADVNCLNFFCRHRECDKNLFPCQLDCFTKILQTKMNVKMYYEQIKKVNNVSQCFWKRQTVCEGSQKGAWISSGHQGSPSLAAGAFLVMAFFNCASKPAFYIGLLKVQYCTFCVKWHFIFL